MQSRVSMRLYILSTNSVHHMKPTHTCLCMVWLIVWSSGILTAWKFALPLDCEMMFQGGINELAHSWENVMIGSMPGRRVSPLDCSRLRVAACYVYVTPVYSNGGGFFN
eukprot:1194367-Prorocentrum_minimum.AAC.6